MILWRISLFYEIKKYKDERFLPDGDTMLLKILPPRERITECVREDLTYPLGVSIQAGYWI